MIELHLIGYTEDREHLVLDLEVDGDGRYTVRIDPDLLATVEQLRDDRVARGQPVDLREAPSAPRSGAASPARPREDPWRPADDEVTGPASARPAGTGRGAGTTDDLDDDEDLPGSVDATDPHGSPAIVPPPLPPRRRRGVAVAAAPEDGDPRTGDRSGVSGASADAPGGLDALNGVPARPAAPEPATPRPTSLRGRRAVAAAPGAPRRRGEAAGDPVRRGRDEDRRPRFADAPEDAADDLVPVRGDAASRDATDESAPLDRSPEDDEEAVDAAEPDGGTDDVAADDPAPRRTPRRATTRSRRAPVEAEAEPPEELAEEAEPEPEPEPVAEPEPAAEPEPVAEPPTRTAHRPASDAVHRARLTPAEIQQRLRAGRSPRTVAKEAGTDVAWIERWLPPIVAERERVLADARRRRLDVPRARALGSAVDRALHDRGVAPGSAVWSVSRRNDGRWGVSVRFEQAKRARTATWLYDPDEERLQAASPLATELASPTVSRGRR